MNKFAETLTVDNAVLAMEYPYHFKIQFQS